MLTRRLVASLFALGLMVLGVGAACGQTYPIKPIRLVTTEPGGGSDFTARLVAPGLAASLGQQVIVDNRAGVLAAELVAKAPPDGYTLLSHGAPVWIDPFLRENSPYDPVRDFSPITLVAGAPLILVVTPALPANSVKELIALAKAKPGALNYASGVIGSAGHLAGELFKVMAGVNIVRVPYKGVGPALPDLIAGQVQMMFPNPSAVAPHLKSGRLRALAVTTAQPSALLPGLPTIAASGVPGFETVSYSGMWASGGTPAALINRLNQEIVRTVNQPEVKQKFVDAGTEVIANSPEQFAAIIKMEMAKWGKLIKEAGIKTD